MATYRLPPPGSTSPRDAWHAGLLAGFGAPGWALAASFVGFGALSRELGLPLPLSLLSTVAIWAMPGQMALTEMQAMGADFLAILLAVTLVNARFLPMTLPLFAHLRRHKPAGAAGRRYRVALYALGQFVALTFWTGSMRVVPTLPQPQRLPWLFGFGLSCIFVSCVATVCGFAAASTLPVTLKLALVFLNPLFFLLVFADDVKGADNVAALLAGAVIGLAVHPFWPDWSLLIGGVVGGSIAFVVGEKIGDHKDKPAELDSPEP
ncbi:MAG TPA: AzlC family ABC transporter permease [Alphaproteobacteria bacterium]|jgi:predicted branched-subunit amino acid permease